VELCLHYTTYYFHVLLVLGPVLTTSTDFYVLLTPTAYCLYCLPHTTGYLLLTSDRPAGEGTRRRAEAVEGEPLARQQRTDRVADLLIELVATVLRESHHLVHRLAAESAGISVEFPHVVEHIRWHRLAAVLGHPLGRLSSRQVAA